MREEADLSFGIVSLVALPVVILAAILPGAILLEAAAAPPITVRHGPRPRAGNAADPFPTQGRSGARWHTRPCLFQSD